MTTSTDNQILKGIRVIDVGHVLAGPMTSSMLGDFGADVIHVENPETGNFLRELTGAAGEARESRGYDVINRSKRNVTINVGKPEGRDLLHKLVAVSDVMTENFRPHVMDRWGNDWATIHKINPRLVYCRLSGYGDTGPRLIRRSYGRIAEAWAGWAYINGHEDGPALHSGFSWGDTLQSIWAANAIVMALYWRDVQGGGEGQLIDSGLVEPLYRAIEQQIIIRDQNNVSIKRFGTQHEGTPYAGISQTKDGRWFSWSAFSQELAGNLLKAVGLSEDARFNTLDKALGYRKEFQAAVTDWMKARTLEEVWSEFEKHQAAGAPVMSGEDLYNDPHIKARDMLVTMPDPEGGKDIVQQGVVPKLSETPGKIQSVSHPIGHHNEEIFCGMLGLSRAELQKLDELGVTKSSKGAL